ncbi:hypothetical protein Pla108_13760 [Botrimarina colliarenosi]|uniref:Methyltransferase domain protein n=1 Tax=Botrimarina colliarenosi TaxID=2528001 RepID=A0A5C6AK51_9BACT|nr:class I SAM-dependent methyltransferase [Botrimarina colliarenosi]TWU00425.1 hypothetical protein Pla108_13760 [Botrimarina colliarenosi]
MTSPTRLEAALLDAGLVETLFLKEASWSEGHGASPGFLGGGILYYALPYAFRARRCVCIGSGGGFVPRMMRQAQRDLLAQAVALGADPEGYETHLIDANLPESGWGSPQWLDDDSFFRQQFPDVIVHLRRSQEVLPTFAAGSVDYLHIDGDHSYEGCKSDFERGLPLLAEHGVMTLHDTSLHLQEKVCGVHRVVAELRASRRFDVVDLPFIGRGVAIVRPRGRDVGMLANLKMSLRRILGTIRTGR